MLTRRKRAASLSSNPDDESKPDVKLTKLLATIEKPVEPVELDEEEKELESFLFGGNAGASDGIKNNEDTIMLGTIEEGSESEEENSEAEDNSETEDEEDTKLYADDDTEEDIAMESTKKEDSKLETETVDLFDILFVDKSGAESNNKNQKPKKRRHRMHKQKNKDKNTDEAKATNSEKENEVKEPKKKVRTRKNKKSQENERGEAKQGKKTRKSRKSKTAESESDPEEERDLEEFLFGNANQICEEDENDKQGMSSDNDGEDAVSDAEPLLSFEICTKPINDVDFEFEKDKEEINVSFFFSIICLSCLVRMYNLSIN